MIKRILFSLLLTTFCKFEVNGLRTKRKSTNPFTNNHVNYEDSSDSLLTTNNEYDSASHFKNLSQIRTYNSNSNMKLKQKRMIYRNQYAHNNYTNLLLKKNTHSANETNLSSDMGRAVIQRTSSLAHPQNNDINQTTVIREMNNNINGSTIYVKSNSSANLINQIDSFSYNQQLQNYKNFSASENKPLDSKTIEETRIEAFKRCNNYRKQFNFPLLTIDGKLNMFAQLWADHLGVTNNLYFNPDLTYGENIAFMESFKNLGQEAVDIWYKQIERYLLNDGEADLVKNEEIKMMTQLLWRSSSRIGIGVSKSIDWYYVVANFDPKGNIPNMFLKNIPSFTQEDIDNKGDIDVDEITDESSGERTEELSISGIIIILRFIIMYKNLFF